MVNCQKGGTRGYLLLVYHMCEYVLNQSRFKWASSGTPEMDVILISAHPHLSAGRRKSGFRAEVAKWGF